MRSQSHITTIKQIQQILHKIQIEGFPFPLFPVNPLTFLLSNPGCTDLKEKKKNPTKAHIQLFIYYIHVLYPISVGTDTSVLLARKHEERCIAAFYI